MNDASNGKLEQLSDVMFFGAAAGTCLILALFFVMTPFFLSSDALSSVLLVGFFVATYGTVYFSYRSYQAERSVEKTYTDAVDELAALRVAQQGRHPGSTS
jgi:hypothetical protein